MTFTAKFMGSCSDCDGTITPGDECEYTASHEVIHVFCPVEDASPRSTCPTCSIELPVTGVCGECDE